MEGWGITVSRTPLRDSHRGNEGLVYRDNIVFLVMAHTLGGFFNNSKSLSRDCEVKPCRNSEGKWIQGRGLPLRFKSDLTTNGVRAGWRRSKWDLAGRNLAHSPKKDLVWLSSKPRGRHGRRFRRPLALNFSEFSILAQQMGHRLHETTHYLTTIPSYNIWRSTCTLYETNDRKYCILAFS